jgi:DNA-binding NarL/FixJ family response regulator
VQVALRVLIVDDHASFREFARRMLAASGYLVVGEAADAIEADSAVRLLQPELVLLDVHLPGEDGLTLASRLTAAPQPPAVVLTSSRDAGDYGSRLTECGARGFIPKADLTGEALDALLGSA